MTGSANSDRPSRQSHTLLLAIDSKNSVLVEVAGGMLNSIAYSVYGYQYGRLEISGRLGFNGELREGRLGWYLLGNGYRAYNPVLMRFHSPDNLSPFGKGGLNAYMYCVGDPVNFSDPSGHMGRFWRRPTSPDLRAIDAAAAARRPQNDTSNIYSPTPQRAAPPTREVSTISAPSPEETVSWNEFFGSGIDRASSRRTSRRVSPANPSHSISQLSREPSRSRHVDSAGVRITSDPPPRPPKPPSMPPSGTPPPLPPRRFAGGIERGSDGVERADLSDIQAMFRSAVSELARPTSHHGDVRRS